MADVLADPVSGLAEQPTPEALAAQWRAALLKLDEAADAVASIMREAGAAEHPELWAALVTDALEVRR